MALPKRICTIPGCGKVHKSRGYCLKHYARWKNHGDPHHKIRAEPGEPEAFLLDLLGHDGDACVKWPYATDQATGYGCMQWRGKHTAAAHAMCTLQHGEPPTKIHQTRHLCGKGNEGCVNPKHLCWGTPRENTDDRYRHGSIAFGPDNPVARLTTEQVHDVRWRIARGDTNVAIARYYRVSDMVVSRIRNKQRYQSVPYRQPWHYLIIAGPSEINED